MYLNTSDPFRSIALFADSQSVSQMIGQIECDNRVNIAAKLVVFLFVCGDRDTAIICIYGFSHYESAHSSVCWWFMVGLCSDTFRTP